MIMGDRDYGYGNEIVYLHARGKLLINIMSTLTLELWTIEALCFLFNLDQLLWSLSSVTLLSLRQDLQKIVWIVQIPRLIFGVVICFEQETTAPFGLLTFFHFPLLIQVCWEKKWWQTFRRIRAKLSASEYSYLTHRLFSFLCVC